jgi:hypothetical protein
MKKLVSWLIVAATGFVLMAFSYFVYQYNAAPDAWKDAFMYIGKGQPHSEAEDLEYVTMPVRLLPLPRRAQNFSQIAGSFGSHIEKSYRVFFQKKVILYPKLADVTPRLIEWGRLPSPGADEVIAGFYTSSKERITVDGRLFKVVGQLKKEFGLFPDSYFICGDSVKNGLFNPDDEAVQNAYVLQLPANQLNDPQMREQLTKAFPKSQFTAYRPMIRTQPGPFYLYIAGISLLFLGGCMLLFKLYCLLSDRLGNNWLRLPLAEIRKYKRLFLTIHLIYFGLVVLFMLVAYYLPELQVCLLAGVKSQVVDGSGPLAVAGKAYMSKNILRAAVTTFVINFTLGSFAVITLPSVIVPGVGVLVAAFRALLWGLLLAPSFAILSRAMLPHSITLLLEGEAYVIATFFGLLILVYLFRKSEGPGPARRYGRALLMNVRGNLLVAVVLASAAIYEAIEVILAMP